MPPETVIDHHIDGERRARETDRVISELAEGQHGRVARRQPLALGIGKGAIDRRVQRRRLRSTGHPALPKGTELDGWGAHGTRRAYERDRARDRLLTSQGWRVVRITWDQLRDGPEAIAADLESII